MVDAWGQLLIRVKQRGPCLPTGVDVISGDMLEELLEAATGEDTSHPTLVDADFTGVTFRGVADFGARPVGARPVWRSPTPEEEIAVGFLGLGARIVALSGIGSDSIGVWDIATREELGRLRLGFSEQFTGAISATIDWIDGQTVVITKDAGGRLGAWDLDTGRQVELVSDWAEVVAVDHGKIAIGDKAQVKVHDALTGDGVGTPVNRQSGDITAAAIGALFPPGRVHRIVATGESDGTVRVWDSETGEQIGETYVPLKGDVADTVVSACCPSPNRRAGRRAKRCRYRQWR